MKIRNLVGSLAISALVASGAIMPAFADYDPVAGTETTFEK